MNDLGKRAFRGLLGLAIAMAALLFLPAWTLHYWQAWLFLAVFFVPSILITVYLMRTDPMLLERRLSAGPTAEKERSQKIILAVATLGFGAVLVVSSLDHRLGWSAQSGAVAITGDILLLLGFVLVFFVYKENSYASATIQVVAGQKVVSTGLYSVVRHPMYMASLFWFVGIPLALGSWWGVPVLLLIVPALIWRLIDEEELLIKNLPGYSEYRRKVKYRLIPMVW